MVVQGHAPARVNNMKVAFRTDASLSIGTGHVMRCLTLARLLAAGGAQCRFVSRLHDGHLVDYVRAEGFEAGALPVGARAARSTPALAHAHWLGADQADDATQTGEQLRGFSPDWLVVDHYGLDAEWEGPMQSVASRMLVIDDLADRRHVCNLLLDQTLGRKADDYRSLVPAECTVLGGPEYALLRPEFAQARRPSLERRRAAGGIEHILVTMGGVDQNNATEAVLNVLDGYGGLPDTCRVTVVMGAAAPWLGAIRARAESMRRPTEVVLNVRDMAHRMANSDLAIGAAGSTSWERCCLGLPTALLVLADNQLPSARALSEAGAVRLVGGPHDVESRLPGILDEFCDARALHAASDLASRVCDGLGANRVVNLMKELS